MTIAWLGLCTFISWDCANAEARNEVPARIPVIPRISQAPKLDGALDDAAWKRALVLGSFTLPETTKRPDERVKARLCYDAEALYVAFFCEENEPGKILARAPDGSSDVWKDDCVELWIRTTENALEYDQFIANSAGARQTLRRRHLGKGSRQLPSWRVFAKVGKSGWVAELAIPFKELGIGTPSPGDSVQLKLGREDRTSGDLRLSTWPPGSKYAGADDYAIIYFSSFNLLRNPTMRDRAAGRVSGWDFTRGDADKFVPALVDGKEAIKVLAPGRYCVANQSLRLKPRTLYMLSARVKGTAGLYLRARSTPKPGEKTRPYTKWLRRSKVWQEVKLRFPSGYNGRVLILVGCTEGTGAGEVYVADLAVRKVVFLESYGPPVLVRPGETPTVIEKIMVSDCRALRGFIGTPIDGTTESRGWNGEFWEYNHPGAGVGVGYAYRNNDGLHVMLSDDKGVDAILVRGGVMAKVYADCRRYDEPTSGKLVCKFPGKTRTSRTLFAKRVMARKLSFFDVSDGYISDLSFFRIGNQRPRTERRLTWGITRPIQVNQAGTAAPFLKSRFGSTSQACYRLGQGDGRAGLVFPAGQFVHFISSPLEKELPLAAMGFRAEIKARNSALMFTLQVQDSLNMRTELFDADIVATKGGGIEVVADFPDQVLFPGHQVWVSVRFDSKVSVSGLQFDLYKVARSKALAQALPYRKLKMKTYFCALSEARPWNNWYTEARVRKSMAGKYGPQLRELWDTIDQCRALGPNDPEVRQYYEWFWRRNRKWLREHGRGVYLDASHARVREVPGAPEWAVVLRQAWLEARSIPQWWIENRMVETGEFGGVVGDDSDMYQNYADFPMLEAGGVAQAIRDGAERLMRLAEQNNLEHGLNKRTMDPLHAYEEGVNHESLLAWWNYGDPVALERCMTATRGLEALTLLTPRGHRHFKSQQLGASDLRVNRGIDRDGGAHPLMLHPAFEVAWYNRNPRAMKLLREWGHGWLEHMAPGKYATSVDVASEKVVATTNRPLYGGYGALGSAFCFLYWLTDDARFLGPFFERFKQGSTYTSPGNILPEIMQRRGIDGLEQASSKLCSKSPLANWILNGEKKPLVEALKSDIAELQNYRVMYTTAEVFTDRVFLRGITRAAICYTGGYATRNKYCHTHAVSWAGLGTDYAALVRSARRDRFTALVYNFARQEKTGQARFWTLEHGMYRLRMGPDLNRDDKADRITRDETIEMAKGSQVDIVLPPRVVTVIELAQEKKLPGIYSLPDLAISPAEVQVLPRSVRVVVHNIGARQSGAFSLDLVDPDGRIQGQKQLPGIEAPVDLVPRKLAVTLDASVDKRAGWHVVVDPGNRVEELNELNNRVPITLPK